MEQDNELPVSRLLEQCVRHKYWLDHDIDIHQVDAYYHEDEKCWVCYPFVRMDSTQVIMRRGAGSTKERAERAGCLAILKDLVQSGIGYEYLKRNGTNN